MEAIARLGRFVTVGAAATLAYAAFAWLLARLAERPALEASILAYAGAAALSYAGHRWVTFRSDRAHRVALPQFLALSAFGCGVAAALSSAGAWLGLPVEAAIAATCLAIPALNYVVLDRIVFRRHAAIGALASSNDGA
jgi:putative flippase GtrA